jgi:hypothetical protein
MREYFKDINTALGLGKLASKNKFTSHMFRKLHASNLARSIKNPDGTLEKGMELRYVDALQGRGKLGSRKSYFFDEFEGLKDQYIHFAHRLKIYTDKDKDFRTEE